MTTFEIIATILIAAALFLLVRGAVKLIDLEQQLTDSENDADTYAREVVEVKTELEKTKDKYRSLVNDYNLLDSFKKLTKYGDVGTYHIVKDNAKADVNVVKRFDSIRNWFVIKSFHYGDAEEECQAWLEAEDLIDALNGRIGWRVKEEIG